MDDQQNLGLKVSQNVTSVEDYKFEPIKGFPMLSWKGKRPFSSTQYYPAQLKENHGEEVNGWLNKIFWGDNLQVMSHLLKEYRGQIDLIYIDPPFDSKADYKKRIKIKNSEIFNHSTSFEEKQYSDIWSNDEYLQFIYQRLILLRELLTDNGSIYLHCDPKKSHYLKLIFDEIFGVENYKAEITWKKATKTTSFNNYGSEHDVIFFYTKSPTQYNFTQQFKPLKESEMLTKYIYFELENGEIITLNSEQKKGKNLPKGRRFRGIPLLNMNQDRPNLKYEFLGYTKVWATKEEKLLELLKNGKIFQINNGMPQRKGYLDENEGSKVNDLWDDINPLNSQALEKTDYPTQKPEKLLERIINISTNKGDIVFDCFMGSGTTQAVAMKLGRKFIGADINLGAIQTTTKRLLNISKELNSKLQDETKYTGFSVYNVNHYDVFRNPLEAKELLIKALEIQPLPNNSSYDGEKDGRMVKIMPINRIATRADLNELITNFDYKKFEKTVEISPNKPVEQLLLVCMGHEPDLAAALQNAVPYKLDVEVVDILRDKANLEFKRDAEAEIVIEGGKILVREFYPMNLMQKLSLMKENVDNWKELVDSIMIDFNYDGAVFEPQTVDVPEKSDLVKGIYTIPENAGTIRIKITDVLSETFEETIINN
ncbi:site-specific DNA-methyltransferase (adenine-specific)/adenine-specific DNA-methyltransferase [Flavobacterium araucananum]|uniref:site-specific DNA-methyltransferase (adenine-specific) n=1 Tax=Flavobacterium araucananum TaxID=946678 RepID=A0A227P2Z7_9FLAO|nr:site-specific DNA-methyltransferase [Flavobacterium araucananum]OXG04297.1 site-specific DNA-methyltransferase [Flavobacterium araucananum]PWJ99996.1 site-specific DNA-methyltransferase (adenine-specific)/adenine-specific DNA-methyltransferase [Flavobacterium araucananum]